MCRTAPRPYEFRSVGQLRFEVPVPRFELLDLRFELPAPRFERLDLLFGVRFDALRCPDLEPRLLEPESPSLSVMTLPLL